MEGWNQQYYAECQGPNEDESVKSLSNLALPQDELAVNPDSSLT